MRYSVICMMIAAFGLMLTTADIAQAKRFGGGSSFGKHRTAPAAQPDFQRKSPPLSSHQQKGSTRSGMMGMLGGLALGGLLGAMFFGGGFEGINGFDLVILGLIVVAVIVWLRRRAAGDGTPQNYAGARPSASPTAHHDFSTASARPEFDEAHFLAAAKTIFMRMQKAWDERNLTEIRNFCTPEVAEKICSDLEQDEQQHKTEVGMLDASIVDAWMEDDQDWVSVHFTAMLKEQTRSLAGQLLDDNTSEMHEIWTFTHDPNSTDPTWYVAGVRQL